MYRFERATRLDRGSPEGKEVPVILATVAGKQWDEPVCLPVSLAKELLAAIDGTGPVPANTLYSYHPADSDYVVFFEWEPGPLAFHKFHSLQLTEKGIASLRQIVG